MNIWRGITSLAARAAGAAASAVNLALPSGGRSSQEPAATLDGEVRALGAYYGGLLPYSPHVLGLLENLAVHSPVVSQACKLLVSTINCGHDLDLQGPKRQVDAARDYLGGLAARIYRRSAGADGLISHYARQLAVSGALASEDVLEPDLSEVRQVAILPASAIRFKFEEADWRPYQHTAAGQALPLAESTFAYYALDTLPGHPPYAVPPFVSAIGPERLQQDFLKSLRTYARKLGIYGVTTVKVPPPDRQPGESEQEYQQRAQDHLRAVAAVYDQILASGLLVMPDNHEVEHKSVTSSAAGVDKISQGVEQLLMSALNIDPAMFGRSFSTTETYAGVVYSLLLRWAAQYQRIIKRRMERSYRLALLLVGLHQVDVSLEWHPQPELDQAGAADAEQTRQTTTLEREHAGIIDLDQAARELGYEKAADLRGAAKLEARRRPGGEQAVRLTLSLAPGAAHYAPVKLSLVSPPPDDEEALERRLQREMEAWAARYGRELAPVAQAVRAAALDALEAVLAGPDPGQEIFVARALDTVSEAYGQAWASPEAQVAVQKALEPIYQNLRTVADLVGAGPRAWVWGAAEQRVLDFAATLDDFYFGKFIANPEARRAAMQVLRQQWLTEGAGLFGRADAAALERFRAAIGASLAELDAKEMRRIIDTSVQRLRCWAAVQQMAEAGAVWAQVWAILDGKTSPICREMHGRLIRVADAAAEVKHLSGLSPAAFEAQVGIANDAVVRREGLAGLQARNQLLPPYHPNCRTRVKLALEDPSAAPMPEGLSEDQQRAWRYWQELGPAAQRARLADAAGAEFKIGKRGRHERKHREIGDYDQATRALLNNPQRVLIRMEPNGSYRLGLMGGDEINWRFGIIDPTYRIGATNGPPRLKSIFGPTPERPVTWTKRSGQLARNNGWVEVMS